MDKRYQVFVSSTFKDLEDERKAVMQTLMKMDCIPAGMEFFPAMDEETFEFIKTIIDDCDYYLIIVGGRYGTLTKDGISFTEKEYDYAISKGLKVIALMHSNPDALSVEKSDIGKSVKTKLEAFKKKVKAGRLVDFWSNSSEIPGKVALNVQSAIKRYPAIGWVRANQVASIEILEEINNLRKENEEIRKAKNLESPKNMLLEEIADLDEEFEFNIELNQLDRGGYVYRKISGKTFLVTWKELFLLISPALTTNQSGNTVHDLISNHYYPHQEQEVVSSLNPRDMDTIKIQFLAYGFIEIEAGINNQESWCLTEQGRRTMLIHRAVKSQKSLPREVNL
jgi:cell division protein ZapA (FtsZ GTPase activity inhibitor)